MKPLAGLCTAPPVHACASSSMNMRRTKQGPTHRKTALLLLEVENGEVHTYNIQKSQFCNTVSTTNYSKFYSDQMYVVAVGVAMGDK